MIKFLVRRFIPDYQKTNDIEVRKGYGVLGGVLGIICNCILFVIKLVIGIVVGSIAIISDGINNLSDTGAALISLVGSKLSSRSPDEGHPYGHGRGEYIASLLIAVLIVVFGVELFAASVGKIINPTNIILKPVVLVLLLLSIIVKIWMWSYNKFLGEQINSTVLNAAAKDSLNDVWATSAVTISTIAGPYIKFPLDGIMGIIVSFLIIYTGYDVARSTIDKLLGKCPDEELKGKIEELVMSSDIVSGIHGLMIHDYGPGRIIASAHAEVPAALSLVDAHFVIDEAEKRILEELNVDMVIHLDPVE